MPKFPDTNVSLRDTEVGKSRKAAQNKQQNLVFSVQEVICHWVFRRKFCSVSIKSYYIITYKDFTSISAFHLLFYCVLDGFQGQTSSKWSQRNTWFFHRSKISSFDGAQGPLHLQCFYNVRNILIFTRRFRRTFKFLPASQRKHITGEHKASALLKVADVILQLCKRATFAFLW